VMTNRSDRGSAKPRGSQRFERDDVIREPACGLHQGQQPCGAARTGRTHGCTRPVLIAKQKLLRRRGRPHMDLQRPHHCTATLEQGPSTPSRHGDWDCDDIRVFSPEWRSRPVELGLFMFEQSPEAPFQGLCVERSDNVKRPHAIGTRLRELANLQSAFNGLRNTQTAINLRGHVSQNLLAVVECRATPANF